MSSFQYEKIPMFKNKTNYFHFKSLWKQKKLQTRRICDQEVVKFRPLRKFLFILIFRHTYSFITQNYFQSVSEMPPGISKSWQTMKLIKRVGKRCASQTDRKQSLTMHSKDESANTTCHAKHYLNVLINMCLLFSQTST